MTAHESATTPREIAFDAPPDVLDALARMGRTEDVRLSPSGRRLAFDCFSSERIALAEVEIAASPSEQRISVTRVDELESPALRQPHGLDFADDDMLVVANRAGPLAVLRLPGAGQTAGVGTWPADGGLATALDGSGAVAVRRLSSGGNEVLACRSYANIVTRHELDADGVLTGSEVLVERWLDVPDGLALSADARWLAISNHNAHSVFLYDYEAVDRDAEPVGILRGVRYPHGVRFGPGDSYLAVADAGAPRVHVFLPSEDGWEGVRHPATAITVMDDDTFARGRSTRREGGPKGIDVDPRTNVLVVTAECLPVAFFDLAPVLDGIGSSNGDVAPLRSELDVLAETLALAAESRELRTSADAANAQLRSLQGSISWRVTAPVRWALDRARSLM